MSVYAIGNKSGTDTVVSVLSSQGHIHFGAIYPGVRLKIADVIRTIPTALGPGVATLQDGHIQITPCESPLAVG